MPPIGFQEKKNSTEDFEMIHDSFRSTSYRTTLQSVLLTLLREQNYSNFEKILNLTGFRSFDVHYFYEEPENGTLLDIACRSKGNCRFVKILILHNANVDFVNPRRGKAPIHEAIESNDIETVKVLCRELFLSSECNFENNFQCKGCDINVTDSRGRNAVMVAAYFARYDILSVLLENSNLLLDPVEEKTILHSLVDGWMEIGEREGTTDENNKYYRCLDLILKQTPRDELHDLLNYIESQLNYYTNENESDRNEFFKAYVEPRLEKYKVNKPECNRISLKTQKEPVSQTDFPSPSQESTLLLHLTTKNLTEFEATLSTDVSTLNHFYPMDEGTLLDIACRSPGYSKFVDIILQHDVIEVNTLNEKTGKAAIHEAVQKSDSSTLRCLLRKVDCDVNLACAKGFTPLDYVAMHKRVGFIEILFDYGARKPEIISPFSEQRLDVQEMQKIVAQYTPVMRAARYGNYQTFEKLMKETSVSVEPSIDNKTVMHMVLDGIMTSKYQNSIGRLQSKHSLAGKNDFDCEKDTIIQPLNFSLFPNEPPDHHRLLKYFLRGADQLQYVNYTDQDGNTALHYAVAWEDLASTEALLQAGAHTCIPNKHGTIPLRSLSKVVLEKHLNRCISSNKYPLEHSDYAVTFDFSTLFSVCKNGTLGRYGDADRRLLSIYSEDSFLDSDHHQTKVDDEVIYVPSTEKVELGLKSKTAKKTYVDHRVTREIEPILIMYSEPELRPLLKHPLVRSYLDIKWGIVGKYFMYNLALYFVYWLLLSGYLYCSFETSSNNTAETNSTRGYSYCVFETSSNNTAGHNSTKSFTDSVGFILSQSCNYFWRISILVLCLVLIFKELFQAYILPTSYWKSPENWLELSLFVSTFVLLGCYSIGEFNTSLAAFVILASWLELVLLVGRHPWWSTHIEMFKTVSLNFFKFLLLYSIMIVAFAFSFYVLSTKNIQTCKNSSKFPTISLAIFKTLVMLTGEYDVSYTEFGQHVGFGHLVFILFVITISIVLFNLLNGLAVGDTQKILAEAETVGIVSRVKFIQYVESTAQHDPIQCLNTLDEAVQFLYNLRPWKKPPHFNNQREWVKFQKKISLNYYLGRYFIKVFPKNGRSDLKKVKIDQKIIDDAVKIVQKTNQYHDVDDDQYPRSVCKTFKRNPKGYFHSMSFS